MNFISDQVKSLQYFSILCVFSVVGLLTIWVLPNTIALRHVFIGIGLISAIVVIVKTKFFKGRRLLEMAPLILFSLIFIWAITHYFLFSLNPDLELQELKSIWLRALAASIIAIGLSIALRINTFLRPYFFTSLFVVSAINLSAYLYLSYKSGSFILPADFVWSFVFKKIEAAFFGVIVVSIACANIINLVSKEPNRKTFFCITLWFLGISMAIISSLVANTKNGVIVALGLCFLLAITFLARALFRSGNSKWGMMISSLFICCLLFGGWKVHTQFASQGWGTLWEDAKISSQLDKHNYWRYENADWGTLVTEPFPKNSYDIPVAGNTYQRVSWATEGIHLLNQYPMGYGSINRSFVGLLNYANIQQSLLSQTHSGWIDFGLAFGVPGLLILFATFICIAFKGFFAKNEFGLIGTWLVLGIVPFGIVAEICYKHNFEILLFYIAFAAASTIKVADISNDS